MVKEIYSYYPQIIEKGKENFKKINESDTDKEFMDDLNEFCEELLAILCKLSRRLIEKDIDDLSLFNYYS